MYYTDSYDCCLKSFGMKSYCCRKSHFHSPAYSLTSIAAEVTFSFPSILFNTCTLVSLAAKVTFSYYLYHLYFGLCRSRGHILPNTCTQILPMAARAGHLSYIYFVQTSRTLAAFTFYQKQRELFNTILLFH